MSRPAPAGDTLKSRVHTSWLIAWLSFGILVGIAAARILQLNVPGGAVIALALAVLALLIRSKASVMFIVAAGLTLGLARGSVIADSYSSYQEYIGKKVQLSGTVADDAAMSPEGEQRLRLKEIRIDSHKFSGTVWISSSDTREIKRGDKVEVSGQINPGFGGVAAAMYSAKVTQLVSRPNADPALEFRDRFAGGVRRAIPGDGANLGLGLLTGQKTSLPEELVNSLRALGLTHIIVASGYNLTILVRFARRLLSRVSRYLAAFAGTSLIAGFTLVTGFSPSMSRAALVAGLSLFAWYYGRRVHPFVLLPLAAAITAYINPAYVWGDLGWYLSFTAFAGVMILAPLVTNYFWGEEKPGILRNVAVETFSAQLLTLPLTIMVFGEFSLLALPANLLVLPLIPLAMILTFVAGLGGLISPLAGGILGFPAKMLLEFISNFASWASNLPSAKGELSINSSAMLLAYLVITCLGIYLYRRTKLSFTEHVAD